MIKRSSKKFIDNLLKESPNWKVLDIGCGYSAHNNASVICDVQDLSNFYKDKKLTFRDKDHWSIFGQIYFGKKIFFSKEFKKILNK